MPSKYKLKLTRKKTIESLTDVKSGSQVTPSDINISDSNTDHHVTLLSNSLDGILLTSKKPSLFDFLNDINYEKKFIIDNEESLKSYPAYQILHILSHDRTCLFYANEVNMRPNLSIIGQYKYLMHSIRKAKRYIKVPKAYQQEDKLLLQEVFNLSEREANLHYQIIMGIQGEFPNEIKEMHNHLNNPKTLIE